MLLDNVKKIFTTIYSEQLEKPNATILKYDFDSYFDQQLRELDKTTGGAATREPPRLEDDEKKAVEEDGDTGGPPPPIPALVKTQSQAVQANGDSAKSTPVQSPDPSRPSTPVPGHLVSGKAGPGGRGSRRARKAAHLSAADSPHASGDDSKVAKESKAKGKKGRKWTAEGLADEDDNVTLDYSTQDGQTSDGVNGAATVAEMAPTDTWGSKTKGGQFVLKDLDDEINNILQTDDVNADRSSEGGTKSAFGTISGYFRNIVGGKTLTKEDLDQSLKAMESHLIEKNVAREAALRICQDVEAEMVGKRTGTFESIDKALRPALEKSLRKILTPKSSLELLQEINSVTQPANNSTTPRPFVISIVGVNGVGKSTNLSKICYFLLQNNLKVLIAAGDTFRSGAVEQLNVHVRNLKELSSREDLGGVDLYQKGYGKDAANIARDAVSFAAANNYDVCLIDTAGRAHTNTTLMSSLEKFAQLAKPDKILMVGEALAGSDLLGQAHNFSRAFGNGRILDGFIISKIDTVDTNVGALVSVVHSTGVPIVFVGVGQTYQDLRNFSVAWAVDMLMKN